MDNASEMMHIVIVSNSMWSRAVITIVYLRNRTLTRAVGSSRGVLLTLLTLIAPKAAKFRVFDCMAFA
jgi:hypothetical protein